MALPPVLVSLGTAIASASPIGLAQTPPTTTDPTTAAGVALIAAFVLIVYGSSVAFSVLLGAAVLGTSKLFGSGTYVPTVERLMRDGPVRSAAIGLAALVGGAIGTFLLVIVLLFAVELGAPEPLPMAIVIPFVAGTAFVYAAVTVGTIALGSVLLRRFGEGEPNDWLALAVGSLVVNVPGVNLLVAPPLTCVAAGAMIDERWRAWRDRGGRRDSLARSESEPSTDG
ncbi:hypothetical protein [Halorubrum sp. DTA98]|uniref:hypothetical protein n=1 Tax=Halorubrum sp. DTA98 TaxID=3402163 RepID=UPI003AB03683